MTRRKIKQLKQRRGSALVLICVMLVLFLSATALSLDVAYMRLVQSQLRSATDAATRAGAEALARGMSIDEARQEIKDIAALNLVGGVPLLLEDSDIVFGTSDQLQNGHYGFTPGGAQINSVRVLASRAEGSASGSVALFFGGVMGRTSFDAHKATTAMILDRDICVVVDRSSSMSNDDAGGGLTRINALKQAVQSFRTVIDQTLGDEQLSLASYDANPLTESQLDLDYLDFDTQIAAMGLGSGTNIGAGIDEGLLLLSDPTRTRVGAIPVMIVMTDGQHNQSRDPVDATTDACLALPQLTVNAITFSPSADQDRMEDVADAGNGRFIHADSGTDLTQAFEEMARSAGVVLIE